MRIADKMQLNQTNTNVLKNRTEMYQLQNQAATQKRINKPSDDPLSSTRFWRLVLKNVQVNSLSKILIMQNPF